MFPPTGSLCSVLGVPFSVYVPTSTSFVFLVAALIPWSQISKSCRRPPSLYLPATNQSEPMILDTARWERSLRRKPLYHHGLQILGFPAWLHNFMAEPDNNSFNVWWYGGDGSKEPAGIETRMLLEIINRWDRRKRVKFDAKEEIRAVFVHVGAVKTLHKLPKLIDRCSSLTTTFWTYGTHVSIEPEWWGMREILPCGMFPSGARRWSGMFDVDFPQVELLRLQPRRLSITIPTFSKRFGNSTSTRFGSAIFCLRRWGWRCGLPKRHRRLCWKGESSFSSRSLPAHTTTSQGESPHRLIYRC